MSICLRIVLLCVSALTAVFVIGKLRKSQIQITDSFFWIFMALGIALLGIFPGIAIFFAKLVGIESPVNFVFLVILFVILVKLFFISLDISRLKYNLKMTIQEAALRSVENVSEESEPEKK